MMRQILSLHFLLVFSISVAVAQNLSLSDHSGPLTADQTVTLFADSGIYNPMYSHFTVHNNGSTAIDVLVKKTELSLVPGSTNAFCWGVCYPITTYISTQWVNIAAGSSDSTNFSGDYFNNGTLGSSLIRYTFYNRSNTDDSVSVIVNYTTTPTAIAENPLTIEFSNAFPNPASNFVNFNYNLQGAKTAEFLITDLLGSELYRAELQNESNKLIVDVASFNAGVYFYSLRVNGKMQFTRKLIVRH
ncbi:MAG: T9SS type A sorting domain-containing protein [Bacteroidales bacterium]|nr:T9SS type A sorting domain-containing protein [Bacteroidales bacterium]